jgi:uncharacterized repeat protein (TIGR03803 family)
MHTPSLTHTLLLAAGILAMWPTAPDARGGVTLTTLVSFNGTNGANPHAGLVQGQDGNFYGTTAAGGTYGYGTAFQVTPSGMLTRLASFNRTNGAAPVAELVQGTNGQFYGTTYAGGAAGYGTVFSMTTNGALTTLISFIGTNGIYPKAGLLQGRDGNYYGTTAIGGSNSQGTVFGLDANGTLTTCVSFDSYGFSPYAGLVQGADDNFYGTTYQGGTNGSGTVFMMTEGGALTYLYSFTGAGDGGNPCAQLVQGTGGGFYGTTCFGGTNGYGTIFRLTADGVITALASFSQTNGAYPQARLSQGVDGAFYGTTLNGGAEASQPGSGFGTVFKLATGGSLTTLVSFNNTNGAYPQGGLVQASDGSFYGTTANGGASGNGTVFRFRITAPLSPIIESVTQAGGTLTLTWSAVAGEKYQLQYKTDWKDNGWSSLGGTVTATNTTLTASDSIGPDAQRLYRVVLLQ